MSRRRRVGLAWANILWCFRTAYSVGPKLLVAAAINAAIQVFLPAGLALSVRGLINSMDAAITGTPLSETAAYSWLVIGFVATLAGSACQVIHRYIGQRLEIDLRPRLHLDIAQHHTAMPLVCAESREYLNALRQAETNPEGNVSYLYVASLELSTKALQMLSLMTILVFIEPRLFFLLLPIGLPYLIFRWRLVRRQFEDLHRRVEKDRRMSYYRGLLTDADQAGEIKLFELGPVFIARYRQLLEELRRMHQDYLGIEFVGNLIFVFCTVSAIYYAMGHTLPAIATGRLSIGDLAIFGGAASQLRALVDQSVGQVANLRLKLLKIAKLREFLEINPGAPPSVHGSIENFQGRVELRNVHFRYPNGKKEILSDLSFTLEPGEIVALVGHNGAGKSTVAKLILGLYQIQEGALLFDGQDSRALDPQQLQRQIGCVFQQFGRYEATAADTLAFGDWQRFGSDPKMIELAARGGGVHELISGMPNGYETQLGRRFGCYQPSGGEWQQLAIARLICRNVRFLVLDEPTASLDVLAEAELFDRFRALAAGRTTLLISHRFTTVSMADRILVMDQGRIVESGSHQELLALNGRYAALFALAFRFPDTPPEKTNLFS